MIRLIAVAFALAFATSAQATPVAPLHQPDGMITQVREACGAGFHMVNGTCVRTAARRNAARCAVGMRTVGGRCVKRDVLETGLGGESYPPPDLGIRK
jgi:hypothetical protein